MERIETSLTHRHTHTHATEQTSPISSLLPTKQLQVTYLGQPFCHVDQEATCRSRAWTFAETSAIQRNGRAAEL